MSELEKRYERHVFVCTHDRGPGHPRGSCAQAGAGELLSHLRGFVHEQGWRGRVRVNASGCLDGCASGVTAVVYPEGRWASRLTADQGERLVTPEGEQGREPSP